MHGPEHESHDVGINGHSGTEASDDVHNMNSGAKKTTNGKMISEGTCK
jgi:hypothetical protein